MQVSCGKWSYVRLWSGPVAGDSDGSALRLDMLARIPAMGRVSAFCGPGPPALARLGDRFRRSPAGQANRTMGSSLDN